MSNLALTILLQQMKVDGGTPSNGLTFCANKPASKPASTSPVPAVANAGFANQLIRVRPFGSAIIVQAPLSTSMTCHSRALLRASSRRSTLPPDTFSPLHRRPMSPGCGVITVPAGSNVHQRSNAEDCSSSASITGMVFAPSVCVIALKPGG